MAANILKRYQIIREIARSNDIVYEAHDPQTGRRIAIKELLIPSALAGQARRERIERFRREARAAGSLSPHPHIVTIYDVDNEGDRYFIVMEYLEGQSLRDILQMEGAVPVERARRFAIQVCEALEHAHARGVIHRDIKPDNIHVLPGEVVKITDFGIARIAADPTITVDGQVFGTPSYMSPEQVTGKPLDARTDIFSLGVTLYEMLTGRKPFTGDTVVTITYNIMNQEPPIMAGVPPEIQQVVLRAMSKAPEARFSSAAEMSRALANASTTTGNMFAAKPASPASILSGSPPLSPSAAAQPGAGPSGPEPTMPEPPPLYVPRRPLPVMKLLSRYSQFLYTLALAVLASLACVLFIWAGNKAYQAHQLRARAAQAAQFVQKGIAFFEERRYAEAEAEFRRAMETAPGTSAALIARGNAAASCINQGNALLDDRPAQAAEFYRKALQYDERSAMAHYGLAMAYHNLKRDAEAIREWEWVIRNAPADPVAKDARKSLALVYYNMGVAAHNAGRYDDAAAAWEMCINTDPGSDIALMAEQARDRLLASGLGLGYP